MDGIHELKLGVHKSSGKEVINQNDNGNRRIQNRMYGGVGGRREQSRLLPDSIYEKTYFIRIIFLTEVKSPDSKR